VLCLTSAAIIIFVEPNAAGSGIPETSAFLNGARRVLNFIVFGSFFWLACLLSALGLLGNLASRPSPSGFRSFCCAPTVTSQA
jgi:hypothetical protein